MRPIYRVEVEIDFGDEVGKKRSAFSVRLDEESPAVERRRKACSMIFDFMRSHYEELPVGEVKVLQVGGNTVMLHNHADVVWLHPGVQVTQR
jgi:hypothetical protein